MNIKKWINSNKKLYKLKIMGDENMEMIMERKHTNTYVKANKKKVLEAIKKCNKKYAKAMKELAK